MSEEKEKYDVLMHVPQQIESIIQSRTQLNPELFNHVLSGLYQTLKGEKVFVDGVDQDQGVLQDNYGKAFNLLKDGLKTALDVETDVDMVNHVKQAVALFDNEYAMSQQRFMDDILETCMTFVKKP